MSTPNWWGDWRPNLTPHTGNLLATDLIECTMIVGGLPVNTVITGAQILGAVPSGGGLDVGTSPITSGTVGRILFQGTGNVLQQSANLFWDNTNGGLGIGQSTPTARIHIQGSSALSANSSLVVFNSTPTEIFRIRDNGNVQIGALTDAGFKLDVNGTARVQGNFNVGGSPQSGFQFRLTNSAYFGGQLRVDGTIITNAGFTAVGPTILTGGQTTVRDGNSLLVGGTAGSVADASALSEIRTTTKGFLPPRMTTTQKNAIASPTAGLVVYDTTLNKLCVRTASAWETITSL